MKILRTAAALVVLAAAARAQAFPAFARKYGMSCSACHVAWPIFNQQGQNFRDSGFQFGLGKDDPIRVSQDSLPISLRTTPAYQYKRVTNQTSDQGPVSVVTSGVPVPPGVDILTGGLVATDISFLLVLSGFSPSDGMAAAESAWVRLDNLAGTGWANVKIGKFELDEPSSAHRNVTLLFGFAVYGAHAPSSVVPFDLGENQVGVEIDGHSARSTTRYSVSFTSVNGGEGLSRNAWSSPMLYGHVQQAFELKNLIVPWVRVGALGAVAWWPTKFDTTTAADGTVTNIPGTGRDHKNFYRAGAELSWYMGYPATPAFFTVAYIYGREEAGLAGADPNTGEDLSGRVNSFNGGFAEVDWVPFSETEYNATPWLFFARYDIVRFKRGSGDVDGGTAGVRRYLAIGPRASASIHIEGHIDRVKQTGFKENGVPRDVQTQSVLAGIDFDF